MANPVVLHITNDYLGSSVYRELYIELSKRGVKQLVYCPMRMPWKNKIPASNELPYEIVYSNMLKSYHRVFFSKKIRFLYKDIEEKISFSRVAYIHASTLFSDGALAYLLHKRYGIPYIVTVRNTDLNLFIKFMCHLRPLGLKILRGARKAVLISPAYKRRLIESSFLKNYLSTIEHKLEVIPNGINISWIKNPYPPKPNVSSPVQLLFVGKSTRLKNLDKLVRAVAELYKENYRCVLNIVGGNPADRKFSQLIDRHSFVKYHGKIHDRKKLRELMRTCDIFTMPSKRETFGLVYLEALTQGLPVVYTKNEGIDGLFDATIGEAVNPNDVSCIKEGIKKVIDHYNRYNFDQQKIIDNYNWEKISQIYVEIYKSDLKR